MALAADDVVLYDPALDRRARLWSLAETCGWLALAPLGRVEEWHRMMDAIEARVRSTPGPLLLAGDLNTTQFSERYARLLSLGLRGVHEDRGAGLATTWPNGRFPFPPIRLDHFLVTNDIAAFSIHEGEGRGSDHRPIVAELGISRR